jgi:hypothetical protein
MDDPHFGYKLKNPKKEHKGESTNWLMINSIWLIKELANDEFQFG